MLLLDEEGGNYHENPVFTASADGTVTIGGKTEQVKANQPITVSDILKEDSEYVKVALEDENGRIYFSDGNGSPISLGYRGTMEIRKYEEGYGVVN